MKTPRDCPSRSVLIVLLLALGAAVSCAEEPSYLYGARFEDSMLSLKSPDLGVHPATSVLEDADNPFLPAGPTQELTWELQDNVSPVISFYAWATLLARKPSGEKQFYTALNLREVYLSGLASQEDLPLIRELSIRGFQAVLDHFPDSVTYDETGTYAWDLATPSFFAIVELGGEVDGEWFVVTQANGIPRAVQP